eukprot:164229-Amphidinium_carterae.2
MSAYDSKSRTRSQRVRYVKCTAFLYADLSNRQQAVCYLPKGTPGADDEFGTQAACLVVKLLYGLRQAPSLWAKALGETLGEIAYTRSEVDPGTPNGRSYFVVHVDDIIVLGALTERQRRCWRWRESKNLSEGDHERFRRAVGQLLWLARDRPDLSAQPTTKEWSMLTKVVRYLGSSPTGWTRIEPTSNFKLDLHLPSRASVKEQPGTDSPSLKAVKKAKREEEVIVISAFADSDWGTLRRDDRTLMQ